ncbi:metallophosphoesterase [Novosphingobium sp. B 225]|uniref:metallophosphoesterase n=1 Tax=Novosphingobium sp. B 225 TaxID=1961849 RepID=UPI000B4A6BFA|nr:metallophosphoesterase [Novosphingobium sp. B 225]
MLIAQATDIHIGFDRGNPDEANRVRLRAVLDRLNRGPNRPDLLLLTGDLTEFGDDESFAWLAEQTRACPFPVNAMVGNHDVEHALGRETLLRAFPGTPSADGFVQGTRDLGGLRLVILDTAEPGRHGGAFCEARAAWLSDQLSSAPDRPTVIVMHHPPVISGIDWMDPPADAQWIQRFGASIRGHGQVIGILAGHVHRTIAASFQGVPVTICPSVAPRTALNFSPVDPEHADQRELITDELPAYALHRWHNGGLVSHFESVGSLTPLAHYDARLQPMIRGIMGER